MGEGNGSRRGALVALGVIAILVIAAVLLTRRLHREAAMQDCVASGRRDCVVIDSGGR